MTYGYHRSRNWINTYGWSGSDYSNQLSLDRSGGDSNWACALDITLSATQMRRVTGLLMSAMRAKDARVSAVREFFGTLDGRTVTGWDSACSCATSADSSHLWHIHISFYRSRANHDHTGILNVLKGLSGSSQVPPEDHPPSTPDGSAENEGGPFMEDYGSYGKPASIGARTLAVLIADLWSQEISESGPYVKGSPSARTDRLKRIEAIVKDIQADVARVQIGDIDIDALARALAPALVPALTPLISAAIAEELARRLRD